MDDDYPDWKPEVKLESELILDSDIEAGASFSVSHPEGYHDVPSETYVEQSQAFPERIELNLAYGLPSISRFMSGASQDVALKMKEKPPENVTLSPDSFVDGDDQNSTEAGPSMYRKEDFVFVSIKSEDNSIEENDTSKKDHLNSDFVAANKETRVKDTFVDGDDQNSTEAGPSMYRKEDFVFVSIKSEDNSVEENDTSKNDHLNSDFVKANKEARVKDSFMDGDVHISTEAGPLTYYKEGFMFSSRKLSIKSEDNLIEDNDTCKKEHLCLDSMEANRETRVEERSMDSRQQFSSVPALTGSSFYPEQSIKLVLSPSTSRISTDGALKYSNESGARNDAESLFNEKTSSFKQCPGTTVPCSDCMSLDATLSAEKRFSCDQCPANFSAKHSVKNHLLTHSNEKVFSCDQCFARFTRKDNLKQHLLIHTKDKTFSCDQCSARFTQKPSLIRHLLIHTNEKPFSCDHCSARFTRKSHLQQHLLIHTKKKPFSCDHCSARFTRKGSLKKHLLTLRLRRVF